MASNDMRGAGPPVNVATASESRLRSVPGIGEARARSLLETRRREPLTQEVLLAMPNFPANFWREKLESEPPEVCCDPEQPDLESTTTEISDIASSHSNTKVKLEPAAEDSTTTGFRQIAQVLTMMEKSMRESQEKILGALMASQERQDQQMLEVMAVLSQRGVASGGPETLLQSSAAPPRKPLNVNRERDVSWGKHATHLGSDWAPHSTTDLHDWRLTQPVRRSAAPTTQSHLPAANPGLPKFTGKVGDPLDWVAFIVNFERRAERYTWDDATRLDFLIECLQDQAAHFFSRLPPHHRCSYALLKEKLRTRFNVVQAPAVLRKQLQDVRQGMEESLQEFASRVQQLARDAHPSLVTEALEPMAVDAFLRGCKEKLAAYSALNREPATVELAVKLVEGAVTNQQAIFGSTVPVSKLRQVLRFENPTQTQPDDYQ
ncbi:hypothetical protein CAPTEDRAFT_208626, partial [Capitella teleta]